MQEAIAYAVQVLLSYHMCATCALGEHMWFQDQDSLPCRTTLLQHRTTQTIPKAECDQRMYGILERTEPQQIGFSIEETLAP